MWNILAIKQSIAGYLPAPKLVKVPYKDSFYFELYNDSKDEMISSHLASNMSKVEIDWINQLALYTSVTVKNSQPNWIHGYFLYTTIKKYCENSLKTKVSFFETGTARGFSALVAVKAILDSGKTPLVVTCDRLNDNRRRYWNAVGDISGKRSRSELLNGYKEYLEYIKFIKIRSEKIKKLDFNELIDIAFLDGPHTYTAAKREFTFVDKFLVPGGIAIFDDVGSKYPGVVRFVDELNGNKTIIDSKLDGRSYAIYNK